VVLSFDFAENIKVPLLNPQLSSFYFHTRRKINLFGITDEMTGRQLNYLIDDCHQFKKDPSMAISMFHHYITTKVAEGASIIFYADNCPGQNKNQTVLAYLSYLVHDVKRHPYIRMNYMIVGHTKFSPDRHFGT